MLTAHSSSCTRSKSEALVTRQRKDRQHKMSGLLAFQIIRMQPELHLTKDCKEICGTVSTHKVTTCQKEGELTKKGWWHPAPKQESMILTEKILQLSAIKLKSCSSRGQAARTRISPSGGLLKQAGPTAPTPPNQEDTCVDEQGQLGEQGERTKQVDHGERESA